MDFKEGKSKGENMEFQPLSEEKELDKEVYERALDHISEEFILKANKMNEGNNGVIMHLNVEILDSGFRNFMKESGFEFNGEQAVKVMKVYRHGEGKREFELQKRAYEIINNDPDMEAIIPRPIFYRDIELSDDLREKLHKTGVRSSNRVELIIMDFIHGDDLATILAREALLRRRPDMIEDDIKSWTAEQLLAEVGPMIDFRIPGGKGKNKEERDFEKMKVEDQNAQKLYKYLHQSGLVIDPTIHERIKRTFNKLHAAGLVHGDAHERNFMISGDYKNDSTSSERNNTVYLIDFGTAVSFQGHYEAQLPDLYVQGDTRLFQDEKVPNRLKELTQERLTKQEQIHKDSGLKLEADLVRFRHNEAAVAKREAWFIRHKEKYGDDSTIDTNIQVKALYRFFFKRSLDFKSEKKWNTFTDYLITFIEQDMTSAESVASILRDLSKDAPMQYIKNTLRDKANGLLYIAKEKSQNFD